MGAEGNCRGRALVVDDDDVIRDLLNHALVLQGFNTRTATGGQEAVSVMDQFCPEVVVTDLLMPGGDGIELISTIRARHSAVGIIVISGGGEIRGKDALQTAKSHGVDYIFPKPFSIANLVASIDHIIARVRNSPAQDCPAS